MSRRDILCALCLVRCVLCTALLFTHTKAHCAAHLFARYHTIVLQHVFRHEGNPLFLEVLRSLRYGRASATVKSQVICTFSSFPWSSSSALTLFPCRQMKVYMNNFVKVDGQPELDSQTTYLYVRKSKAREKNRKLLQSSQAPLCELPYGTQAVMLVWVGMSF